MATEHGEPKPKTFSLVRVGLAVGLVVALLYGLWSLEMYSQRNAAAELTRQIEAESFVLLSAAGTPDELREAVGDQGDFFLLSDGEWLAIRYCDVHTAPYGSSSGVAVDSGGNWWVSYHHFCGRFRIFRRQAERFANAETADMRDYIGDPATSFPLLTKLQTASSLESLHETLRELGFQATSPP